MPRKRIIFSLIYADGKFNQSRNFRLQKVGDINWLERNYRFKDIAFSLDELIVLNASKDKKNIKEFAKILERLACDVFIPVASGGGVHGIEEAKLLFNSGADKLVLNSLLYTNPNAVRQIIRHYGSQSIVASIDYRTTSGKSQVYINNGAQKINTTLDQYIEHVQNLGVGELYLNSIEKDGTGFGYDFDTIDKVAKIVKIPLIIAGGAGNEKHLIIGLENENVDAVATANLFNFIGNGIPNSRKSILSKGISIAKWK